MAVAQIDKSLCSFMANSTQEVATDEFNKIVTELNFQALNTSIIRSEGNMTKFSNSLIQLKEAMLTLTNAKAREQAVDIFVEAKMLEKRICSTPKNPQSSGFSFSEVRTEFRSFAFDGDQAKYSEFRDELDRCFFRYTTLSSDEKLNLLLESFVQPFRSIFISRLPKPHTFATAMMQLTTDFGNRTKVKIYLRQSFSSVQRLTEKPTSGQMEHFRNKILQIKFNCQFSIDEVLTDIFIEEAKAKLPYWLKVQIGNCDSLDQFVDRVDAIIVNLPSSEEFPPQHNEQLVKSFRPTQQRTPCFYCSQNHPSSRCQSLTSEQKINFLNAKRVCHLCLRPGHNLAQCSSNYTCYQCGAKHRRELHDLMNNLRATVAQVSHSEN